MKKIEESLGRAWPRVGLTVTLVVLAAAWLLITLAWSGPIMHFAPVLGVAGIEPSGIFDDSGSEMWLVTFSISNSANLPPTAQNYLYLDDGKNRIEARVANRWTEVMGSWDFHALPPGHEYEKMFLVPKDTDLCRVSLKYTGAKLIKGRIAWLAEHLPQPIRYRMSYKFWRWVGFSDYGPCSSWREMTLELTISEPKEN
jgi:hypothetical protein